MLRLNTSLVAMCTACFINHNNNNNNNNNNCAI